MYGISELDKKFLKFKLKNQKKFLDENFLYINGECKPYSDFYFSSWHNSNRYIAELNNRVSSLNKYANDRGLKPIFAVLTLPSEYHRKKIITLKSGRKKLVNNKKFIDDENHTIKAGSDRLQSVVRSIMNSNTIRSIPKYEKCYITTKEPHKDGTCHLNLLLFVPKKFLSRSVNVIKNRFLDTHSKVTTDIKNPTAYIMKYIFKTLDDLRENSELENLTDITFWYLKHKIRRFTMSQTFISLEIYRKLNGRYSLISLTKNYNKGLITVLLDPESKKPMQIFDEFGEIWQKRRVNHNNSIKTTIDWQSIKENRKDIKLNKLKSLNQKRRNLELYYSGELNPKEMSITNMSDWTLTNYYLAYDHSDENVQRLAILENELYKRGFNNLTNNNDLLDLNDIDELYNHFIDKEMKYLEF
ncbi:radical SAM protein [Campylobacter corcagiensis]|uniref:Replication endonuclease n=1 Tax=Campylobacter corcagiensis TaxID=1448857 RepID=A0A7M1LEY7_9BACT|nr:radical SAM protein [Campylobacter corcagiensis]QKF64693.1 putative phage replication initiation protein [Campylobacter corcagiensis]QOQ87142.1 hypothetical protein IMC76_07995 [Campylobacter corcagiensis]